MRNRTPLLILTWAAALSDTLSTAAAPLVFPSKAWATRTPYEAGLDGAKLDAFVQRVGGDGVIIKGGFNFWFNEPVGQSGSRSWPSLPADAYQANGMWNRDTVTVIPSLRTVIAVRGAKLGPFEPGKADGVANQNFQLLVNALQASAPYPPSPVIASLEWAPPKTIVRRAKGSDNFPLTWSNDDALYTTYGDGFGFEPFVPTKLSLGLTRITGIPNHFQTTNLRSVTIEQLGEGRKGRKGWGLLSVNGVLYLWMGHADRNGGQAQLAWSKDHGKTWTHADWRFAEFGLVGFINFGKDYAGARDELVRKQWDTGPGEHGDFPSKWMSADGRTLYLVFSGNDQFCVRKATLTLRPTSQIIQTP